MKNLMNILFVVMVLFVTACGGGGGGAGGTTDGGTTTGGTGGGVTGGGDGNTSYYGFTSSGTEKSDIALALPASNTFSISNDFYFKAVDTTTPQTLELGVYQPTCLLGASSKDYSMVLMTKGNTAEATISMRVTSSGITTVVDAYDQTQNYKSRYGTTTSSTGTCTNGKMTLTSGDIVYSNGHFAVYKKGTDVYVGMSSSIALNPLFKVNADIKLSQQNAVDEYFNLSNGTDRVTSRSANDTATTMATSVATYYKYFFTNNTLTIDDSYSIRLHKSVGGGDTEMVGVQGIAGGRTVNMFVASVGGTVRNANLGDSNGPTRNYSTLVGASSVYISIEN